MGAAVLDVGLVDNDATCHDENGPPNNFAQLTEKIDKLEKALKKSGKKGKKRRYEDSDSDSE